jgi:DMSO/TMAO reductase YedYZ molybdopterin-dependent catalytic subunit
MKTNLLSGQAQQAVTGPAHTVAPDDSRRKFLKGSSLLAISAAVGTHVPFARFFPAGLIPVALAQSTVDLAALGKHPELVVLGDKPLVAETPAHLLDDDVTPVERLFVRNNGVPPEAALLDPGTWTLTIDGESTKQPMQFALAELKSRFRKITRHIALECAGNGRAAFYPPAKGNQWTYGGVGFPMWTGVRLADVLKAVGVKEDAVYIGYYGADTHLSGDTGKPVISRGIPIAKALQDDVMLAWEVNGHDLPTVHGYPLRLIVAGYPGSTCGKWLQRIAVRNKIHDGPKMGGHDYRLPCEPIAPGEDNKNYCIIEAMPVKSLITFPRSGIEHPSGKPLAVRGQAWTGQKRIDAVHLSYDFGQTWVRTRLTTPRNPSGPQRFATELKLPTKGYYEIWARATDDTGKAQPMVAPGWNAGGYASNAMHRIAVRVT